MEHTHNPKVVGSNPAPATNFMEGANAPSFLLSGVLLLENKNPNGLELNSIITCIIWLAVWEIVSDKIRIIKFGAKNFTLPAMIIKKC